MQGLDLVARQQSFNNDSVRKNAVLRFRSREAWETQDLLRFALPPLTCLAFSDFIHRNKIDADERTRVDVCFVRSVTNQPSTQRHNAFRCSAHKQRRLGAPAYLFGTIKVQRHEFERARRHTEALESLARRLKAASSRCAHALYYTAESIRGASDGRNAGRMSMPCDVLGTSTSARPCERALANGWPLAHCQLATFSA